MVAAAGVQQQVEHDAAAASPAPSGPGPATPLSKDDFKQQVVSALTIFLGTSKALHERADTLDADRRRELTSMLVRKAEELQGLLAPVIHRL